MARTDEVILNVRQAIQERGEMTYDELLDLVGRSASQLTLEALRREFKFSVARDASGTIRHTIKLRE